MRRKSWLFILLFIYSFQIASAYCTNSLFISDTSLPEGNIHSIITDGVYLSTSPCFTPLKGNISVYDSFLINESNQWKIVNLSGIYSLSTSNLDFIDNKIILNSPNETITFGKKVGNKHYVTSRDSEYYNATYRYHSDGRLGLIQMQDNNSIFYYYSPDNNTLKTIFYMNGNQYYLKKEFYYGRDKLTKVSTISPDGFSYGELNFNYSENQVTVWTNLTRLAFNLLGNRVQSINFSVTYNGTTYGHMTYFIYDGGAVYAINSSIGSIRCGGGVCTPIPDYCFNLVEDNQEEGIDCGGSCPPCQCNSSANQLVRNGNAENGTSNWNFAGRSNISHSGNYSFYQAGSLTVTSSDFIPINSSLSYLLEGWFQSYGIGNSKLFFGLIPYDANMRRIESHHVNIIPGTETLLYESVSPYQRTIKVMNASRWTLNQYGHVCFNVDISGNYSDIPNRNCSTSYNITNITNKGTHWQVDFASAINVSAPAGTKVREHARTSAYMYDGASWAIVPSTWQKYNATINNENTYGVSLGKWWRGTRYAKIIIFPNYYQNSSYKLRADDISLTQTSQQSCNSSSATFTYLITAGKTDYINLPLNIRVNLTALLPNSPSNMYVFLWNGTEWRISNKGRLGWTPDSNISPGTGFGVQAGASNYTINITGARITSPVTVNISGDSLIGIPYCAEYYTASRVISEINAMGGNCTGIYKWSYANQSWMNWNITSGGNNFQIEADKAYFISCRPSSRRTWMPLC